MVEQKHKSWRFYYPLDDLQQFRQNTQTIFQSYNLTQTRTELDVLEIFQHTAVSHSSILVIDRIAQIYWQLRCNHGCVALIERSKSFLNNPHYDFAQHIRYFHMEFRAILDELFHTLKVYEWTLSIDRGSLCLELNNNILVSLQSQYSFVNFK